MSDETPSAAPPIHLTGLRLYPSHELCAEDRSAAVALNHDASRIASARFAISLFDGQGRELGRSQPTSDLLLDVRFSGEEVVARGRSALWRWAAGWPEAKPIASRTAQAMTTCAPGRLFLGSAREAAEYDLDGQLLRALPKHRGTIVDLSADANGTVLATASGKIARLWPLDRAKPKARLFRGATDDLTTVRVSRRADYIAAGTRDHQVFVWSVETGEVICQMDGAILVDFGGATSDVVCRRHRGSRDVVGDALGHGGAVFVFDPVSQTERVQIVDDWLSAQSVGVSGDGQHVAVADCNTPNITVYDASTGAVVLGDDSHRTSIVGAVSVGDVTLSADRNGHVFRWRGTERDRVIRVSGDWTHLSASPDSARVALAGRGLRVLSSETLQTEWTHGLTQGATAIDWSRGDALVVVSRLPFSRSLVEVLRPEDGDVMVSVESDLRLSSVRWTGEHVWALGGQGGIQIDPRTGEIADQRGFDFDRTARLMAVARDRPLGIIGYPGKLRCMRSYTSRAAREKDAWVVNLETGEAQFQLHNSAWSDFLRFCGDYILGAPDIISAHYRQTAKATVWSLATGEPLPAFEWPFPACTSVSADEAYVWYGSRDGRLARYRWNALEG